MAKLMWDDLGQKLYETGVSNAVLYLQDGTGAYNKGVAWNGLTKVTESPSGAEATPLYADNVKYLNLMAAEEFGGTIEAYTYPDEFLECDGGAEIATGIIAGQQARKPFGLCYKTLIGNDVKGNDYGYKLHIVYGCLASPSSKDYQTINDSPEAISLSWEFKSTPVPVTGQKPTATLVIDSTKVNEATLAAIEEVLYGTDTIEASLPLPDDIIALVQP